MKADSRQALTMNYFNFLYVITIVSSLHFKEVIL